MKRFYISRLIIFITTLLGLNWSAFAQTTTLYTVPGTYTYTVTGNSLYIDMAGGMGGASHTEVQHGGYGGRVQCVLTVSPGQVLQINVAGAGVAGVLDGAAAGGFNGGGVGGYDPGIPNYGGGAGGGASDIRSGAFAIANRLVVAGGGGGGGDDCTGEQGGNGGGTTAVAGSSCNGTDGPGGAGTPSMGGAGGVFPAYGTGTTGGLGIGGGASTDGAGGGGGSGYWGGGGASWAGGGGGSSFTDPIAVGTAVTHTQGYNTTGAGYVTIISLCNGVGTIMGNNPVCRGNTFTLSNPTGFPTGTWSSSNTSVASISAGSGLVTGVLNGTAIITYTVPSPCGALATAVVTINPLPLAIVGPPSVCTGIITPFAETTTGGTWSSGNPSTATVDGSGNVTGLGPGSTGIIYTLPTSCSASFPVTVNSAPGPLLGSTTVCKNATTALTDVVSGGTWTSGAGTIATVSSSGNVGGVAPGSSNISYTLSTGCAASKSVTVEALPNQYIVEGTNTYCVDSTDTVTIKLNSSDLPAIGISYQVYSASLPVGSPLAGTGGELFFPAPSSPGTYTVIGTNTTTGCVNTMDLSATVTTRALPNLFTVTGGGSYCQFGTGVPDSLSGSSTGISYKLYYNGVATTEAITGAGAPLSFGDQTGAGTYTVVGSYSSTPACPITMSGSAIVSISPLPTAHNVTITNGGNYCEGGIGVTVGLDYADPGISYQLYYNGSISGSPVTGTGGPLSFGLQTAVGSYSVGATNTSTLCTNNMTGIVSVNTVTPPPVHNVIVAGDPTGCVGSSFPDISLDGSEGGVNYQLYNDGIPVGSPVTGTGLLIDFGAFTDSGTYTVIATDQTYFCTSTMNGSAVINLSPLPAIYNVTGGGGYCELGTTGVPVMLDGSVPGISYTLFYGGSGIRTLGGTGSSLNFGDWTVPGVYTISAVNSTTFCGSNMAGSAVITINPLPLPFNVFGGGSYCAGSIGIDLGLDFSAPGVNYQLYNGGMLVGASIAGTGDSLDFGYHTPAGTYTIVGTNPSTGCLANMSGSATITINALPNLYSVSGGGSYCSGGAGDSVNLNGSGEGINYQLYNGVTAIGSPLAGTGASISFGLQTMGGTYTVAATNTLTQCTKNMSGAATVVVNATPGVYTVTGGGIYCAGASGVHVGLSGSNAGVRYLLYNGSVLESTVTGIGATIDFGLETSPGTYTVVATNAATGCTNNMTGDAVIATNMPPTVYSVIGGGSYCAGSSAIPSVGLGGSDAGISYQLYHGSATIGSAAGGTGAPLDFGTQSAAGTYTIVATNPATGCIINMSGSASVAINPLPSVYTVTGGGSYCAGGDGYHIYMSISNPGISYILYQGATVTDTVGGTGAGVDFGLQTIAGSYTAIAVNPATGCMSNMAGSAVIVINPLPSVHTVTGGGNYCVTGSGVAVGLDGSNSGVSYQLYNGLAPAGAAIGGTGSAVNFGIYTAGSYTIVATNAVTGCKSNMTGSAMVSAIPLPNVYAATGGGNYCTTGLGLHVGLGNSDLGTQYQLYYAATPTGIVTPLGSPIIGTSGALDFGLYTGAGTYTVVGVNGGSLGCSSNMSGAAVIAVYPVVIPTVSIATAGGDTVCAGVTTHFTASSINGGLSPVYNWIVNGITEAIGSGTYSYVPIDGDIVKATVQSDGICAIPDTASTTIMMSVSPPELPSVNVTAIPGHIICEGSSVTFSAAPRYSGFHPTYTWLKNSVNVVGFGSSYTYIPANNDIIVLMMGSSFPCRTADTVFSNPTEMEVDPPVIPKVIIIVNPGTQITPGQNVTLTATVIDGGSAPSYQWLINGVTVSGATNASFSSSSLSNNDSVSCDVIGVCALKGFNSVRMHVGDEGVQQITGTGSDNIKLLPNPNKGIFTIKGTLGTSGDEEVSIEVVNMLGQAVYNNKVMTQNGNINETIQLSSSLANGMYMLNLRSGTQNNVFHFVIEQ